MLFGLAVLLSLAVVITGAKPQRKIPLHPETNIPGTATATAESGLNPSTTLPPAKLPAFPSAEGFGAKTPGGRFGRILLVTNLNDTTDVDSSEYQGSLRWALKNEWADDPASPYDQRRFVIFKVGGTIKLQEPLVISHPYTTLAGQTAPGGITLRREGLKIATHDVIVRGLRVRVGDEAGPSCCRDGVNISTSDSSSDIYNVIVDHISVSWAIDENFSFYVNPDHLYSLHDMTVQWSVISEGLHHSVHIDEKASAPDPHSMGMIIENGATNISIHHNLFAQNWGRNPRLAGVNNVEFLNNVVYAWNDKAVEISGDANAVRLVGNYFKLGSHSEPLEIVVSKSNPNSVLFFDENIADDGQKTFAARISSEGQKLALNDSAMVSSRVMTTDALSAYSQVLDYAGALTPSRDPVDRRVMADLRAGTGSIIDSPLQVGGWSNSSSTSYPIDDDHDGIPSDWEAAHGLDPTFAGDANNPNMPSPDGYSWIEEYVNSLIPLP